MILWAPVRFFAQRLAAPPAWLSAGLPVAVYAALSVVCTLITFTRVQTTLRTGLLQAGNEVPEVPFGLGVALAVFSVVLGLAIVFWIAVGVLAVVDVMFVGSGRGHRLIELSALSYWSQVPWAVASCFLLFFAFHLEPPPVSGSSNLPELLARYQEDVERQAFMRTYRLIGAFFGLWLVGLQACALRVVTGLRIGAAWSVGLTLGVVLVLLPWAIQRF